MTISIKEKPALGPKNLAKKIAGKLKPREKAKFIVALGHLLKKELQPEKKLSAILKQSEKLDAILNENNIDLDSTEREELEKELYSILKRETEEAKAENTAAQRITEKTKEEVRNLLSEPKLSDEQNTKLILLQLQENPDIERLVGHLLREAYEEHDISRAIKDASKEDLKAAERIVKRLTLLRKGRVGRLVHKALNKKSIAFGAIPRGSDEWRVAGKSEVKKRRRKKPVKKKPRKAAKKEIPQTRIVERFTSLDSLINGVIAHIRELTKVLSSETSSDNNRERVLNRTHELLELCSEALERREDTEPMWHHLHTALANLSSKIFTLSQRPENTGLEDRCVNCIMEIGKTIASIERHLQIGEPPPTPPLNLPKVKAPPIPQAPKKVIRVPKHTPPPPRRGPVTFAKPAKPHGKPHGRPQVPKAPKPIQIAEGPTPLTEEQIGKPPGPPPPLPEIQKSAKEKTLDRLFDPKFPAQNKMGVEIIHGDGKVDRVLGFNAERNSIVVRRILKNGSIRFGQIAKEKLKKRLQKINFRQRRPINFEYERTYAGKDSINTKELGLGDVILCKSKDGVHQFEVINKSPKEQPIVRMISGPKHSKLSRAFSNSSKGLEILMPYITASGRLVFNAKGDPQTSPIEEFQILIAPKKELEKEKPKKPKKKEPKFATAEA